VRAELEDGDGSHGPGATADSRSDTIFLALK